MTIEQALEALGDRSSREEGGRVLHETLTRLADGTVVEPRTRLAIRIPSELRGEIVARVALKVLEKAPLPVQGQGDAACTSYLQSMLARHYLSEYRRREKPGSEPVDARSIADSPPDAGEPDREQAGVFKEARDLLGRVYEVALNARLARYRPPLQTAWGQLVAIVFEEVPMADVLARDEGVEPDWPAEEIKRARGRLHTAHLRLRRELREAFDSLVQAGKLSVREQRIVEAALELLVRRQDSDPSRSSGEEH